MADRETSQLDELVSSPACRVCPVDAGAAAAGANVHTSVVVLVRGDNEANASARARDCVQLADGACAHVAKIRVRLAESTVRD